MDSIAGPNNRFAWVCEQVRKGDYLPVQKKFDHPYNALPAPSKIPGAALEFPLNIGKVFSVHLFLNNALCEVLWENGTKLQTFVHASEPVGWFVFENLPDTVSPEIIAPRYSNPDEVAGDTRMPVRPWDASDINRGRYRRKPVRPLSIRKGGEAFRTMWSSVGSRKAARSAAYGA